MLGLFCLSRAQISSAVLGDTEFLVLPEKDAIALKGAISEKPFKRTSKKNKAKLVSILPSTHPFPWCKNPLGGVGFQVQGIVTRSCCILQFEQ